MRFGVDVNQTELSRAFEEDARSCGENLVRKFTRMVPGGPTGLALSEFEVLMLTEVRFGNVVDCLALRTNRPNPNRQDLRES